MSILQHRDAFFSSQVFLSACAAFADELARARTAGDRVDFRQFDRLQPHILQALDREFDSRCGYCGGRVGVTSPGSVDRFFPKSKFPERALDPENLVLSCLACNVAKRDQFPTDATNKPLLLNPRTNNIGIHLQLQEDGTVQGLTPQGTATIMALRLNRPGLVDERRRERQYERLAAARPELRAALLEDKSHSRFLEAMESVRSLNAITSLSAASDQPLRLMLYASIIACLEAYLGDALIATSKNSRRIMRKFVKTFHDFKDVKFALADIFATYDKIDEMAIEAMANVLYHNLPKVKGIYRDTLGVEFPKDIGPIVRAVVIRHDIVHRNGKDKDGVAHVLSSADVEDLAAQVTQFVAEVQKQIDEVRRQSATEDGSTAQQPAAPDGASNLAALSTAPHG